MSSRVIDGVSPGSSGGASAIGFDALVRTPAAVPEGTRLGRSREGRPLSGHRFGTGPVGVSLIGGCHADEPVGPWLLDRLVARLALLPADAPPLTRFSWWIVPHANPDGEARNAAWTAPLRDRLDVIASTESASAATEDPAWHLAADPAAYAHHVVREQPGDDVEFGFPRDPRDAAARPENRAIAAWWETRGAPFHLHVSLHGMGVARGPWFLVEPAWRDRIAPLVTTCRAAVAALGYELHDDARTGDKGFDRITEGFSTRPDSRAMAAFFEARGEDDVAARFRPSSMETIRALGGDPLTLVTEMPLFLVSTRPPGVAAAEVVASGDVIAMSILDQWRLQWTFIEAGLALVTSATTVP
jgi:hypothetical protein